MSNTGGVVSVQAFKRLCHSWGFVEEREGGDHTIFSHPSSTEVLTCPRAKIVPNVVARFAAVVGVGQAEFLRGPQRPRRQSLTAHRRAVLRFLHSKGGAIEDDHGRIQVQIASAIGSTSQSVHHLLCRMEDAGQIDRLVEDDVLRMVAIRPDGPRVREALGDVQQTDTNESEPEVTEDAPDVEVDAPLACDVSVDVVSDPSDGPDPAAIADALLNRVVDIISKERALPDLEQRNAAMHRRLEERDGTIRQLEQQVAALTEQLRTELARARSLADQLRSTQSSRAALDPSARKLIRDVAGL